jgi:CHAT domain-containing protein/tetratricopeptide (TPR) repeat protein
MKKYVAVACTVLVAGSSLSTAAMADQAVKSAGSNPAVINQSPTSQLGNYATGTARISEPLIKELEKLSEMAQTPQSMEKIKELEGKGEKFFQQHLLSQALQSWQEMYGMCLEMKYSEGQGRALTNMARVYLEQGNFIKAKYLGENAVEVLANVSDQQALARARVALAQAYFGLDNPVWATQQLDSALKVLTGSAGLTDPAEAARVTYLCGNLCIKFNKNKEALRFFQEGATYSFQAGDVERAVQVRLMIVSAMVELGWFTAALEEANKLLSLARSNPKYGYVYQVPALQALANAQYSANEYSASRQSFEKAYALLSKIDSKSFSEEARANMEQGYACALSATGDSEQARQYFLRALPYFKAKSDTFNQAQSLNALGVIEALDNQFPKAVADFQQAIDLHAVMFPKAPHMHACTMINLAVAEFRSGAYRDCRTHLEGAFSALGKLREEQLRARIYQSLAEAAFKGADLTAADKHVASAIELGEKVKDDNCLWRSYLLKARLEIARQEVDAAKESLTSAASYFRSPQAGVFPSADNLDFPYTREDMGFMLVQTMASQGLTEQALLAAEQIKEENFISEWLRRGGQVKPEDKDVYTELTTLRSHCHAAEITSVPATVGKEWKSWMERFRSLVQTNRNLARLIAPVPNTTADIIATVQNNKAAAVEYLVGTDATMAFTIDNLGRISSTSLPVGRARLKSQVAALLVSATGAQADERSGTEAERVLLKSLYLELLPSSVRQFLPQTPDQMLVVIPDGPLFNLPFAALVDEHGKFFVENHLLTMASSMTVLMDSHPVVSDELNMLMASSNNARAGSEFSEAEQISSAVGPERVTSLVGKDASITNLEEQSKGKSVVHITAKLPLVEGNPLRSVLPLFGDKDDAGKKVTADRLFGTPMASDIIVWSASSVNSKDVRGNAVKIFSRGLNYAGARNVLMSLWWQPDAPRIDELVSFFKSKQAGLNPAQSLRKAQLAALSKDPSPRTWAGFQLLGPGQ